MEKRIENLNLEDGFWEMRQQNCFLIQREPLTT